MKQTTNQNSARDENVQAQEARYPRVNSFALNDRDHLHFETLTGKLPLRKTQTATTEKRKHGQMDEVFTRRQGGKTHPHG